MTFKSWPIFMGAKTTVLCI